MGHKARHFYVAAAAKLSLLFVSQVALQNGETLFVQPSASSLWTPVRPSLCLLHSAASISEDGNVFPSTVSDDSRIKRSFLAAQIRLSSELLVFLACLVAYFLYVTSVDKAMELVHCGLRLNGHGTRLWYGSSAIRPLHDFFLTDAMNEWLLFS